MTKGFRKRDAVVHYYMSLSITFSIGNNKEEIGMKRDSCR